MVDRTPHQEIIEIVKLAILFVKPTCTLSKKNQLPKHKYFITNKILTHLKKLDVACNFKHDIEMS